MLECHSGLLRTGCAPKAVGRPSAASAAASSASATKSGALARSASACAAGASCGSLPAVGLSCSRTRMQVGCDRRARQQRQLRHRCGAPAHLLASALALWCPLHSAMRPLRSERLATLYETNTQMGELNPPNESNIFQVHCGEEQAVQLQRLTILQGDVQRSHNVSAFKHAYGHQAWQAELAQNSTSWGHTCMARLHTYCNPNQHLWQFPRLFVTNMTGDTHIPSMHTV